VAETPRSVQRRAIDGSDATVQAVGALLGLGTLVVVGLVVVGSVLMLASGLRPIVDQGPALDPGTLLRDVIALRPEGFLWARRVWHLRSSDSLVHATFALPASHSPCCASWGYLWRSRCSAARRCRVRRNTAHRRPHPLGISRA
jgi:hypothetical protein